MYCYAEEFKYPDYAYEFLGPDKHETYNRKMFDFNVGLNKILIKPIHILWATVMPQYGMDRIYGISNNIEYPIRLVSSLVQRDFHNAGNETKRFIINTTLGLAGMFDPAKHILKIERSRDNMDKALSRCNVKSGPYFVAPVINFTTVRGLFGRILDVALNPTTYIGTPILAAIKAAITINRTSYLQSIITLIEDNFADPYYVTKLAFGIDGYIKKNNYDRVEVISQLKTEDVQTVKTASKKQKAKLNVSAKIIENENIHNKEISNSKTGKNAKKSKILNKLQKKHNRKFNEKIVFGTSLAGLDVLYMAQQESTDNTLGNAKFIAICPPIDLIHSVNVIDGYTGDWVDYADELKQKVAYASAKLVKLYQSKDDIDSSVNHLPFDEDEAKLFTSFIMHEKLANVVFELEKAPINKKKRHI